MHTSPYESQLRAVRVRTYHIYDIKPQCNPTPPQKAPLTLISKLSDVHESCCLPGYLSKVDLGSPLHTSSGLPISLTSAANSDLSHGIRLSDELHGLAVR